MNLSIFFFFILFSNSICEIKFVIQISNEGSRTSRHIGIDYLDNGDYNENELTEIGIKQLIMIGTHLRKHYTDKYNLVDNTFNRDEMKLYSIGNNVNIESLNYMMNGYYPKEKIFPVKQINLMPEKCQRLEKIEITNKNKFKAIVDSFSKKYSNHFRALPNDFFQKYDNVFNFCDSILSAKAENSIHLNGHIINDCKRYLNTTYYNIINDDYTNPIRITNILDQIVKNIDSNLKCFDRCAKYIIYSISSNDIAAILYFFNEHFKIMQHFPAFNSIILIELEEANFRRLIKIHFNDKHLITIDYLMFKDVLLKNIKTPEYVDNYCLSDDTLTYQVLLLLIIISIVLILSAVILQMIGQMSITSDPIQILEHKSNDRSFTYEYSKNYLYKN
jgi:hypothetical protein